MAEEKDAEERKPFITFSFTEEGNFDRYAGIYLHLPLEKPPTGEEIAIMVGTIKTYAKCWAAIQDKLGMVEAVEQQMVVPRNVESPPPGEPHEASRPKPARSSSTTIRDPDSAATSKQCGMIRGLCGKVSDEVAMNILGQFEDLEGKYDVDGHYVPDWDFLNGLTKGEASQAIEALKKAE